MKLVILISVIVGFVAAQSFYTTEDDYVDIDAVVEDLPSLQAYADCYLDRGPCTSQTQSYKDIIEDSMVRTCDKCNVPQKQRYGRFLQGLRSRLPEDYQSFREKYDPMNMYMDALEAELSEFANQPLVQRPAA